MINVTDETKSAYLSDSIHKNLTITIADRNVTFTNVDIVSESLELTESIETTRALTFKGCIATRYKFKVAGIVTDLRGEYVEASIQASNTESIPLFKGYIDSQNNLTHEDILTEFTCYDALYSIGERDMQSWVDGLSLPMTVKQFRTSLFTNLGITQENNTFINDSLSISADFKTAVDKPSARELMQWLCQINARFGQIGRDGIFYYRELTPISRGLYPSTETYPSEETYPSAESAGVILSPGDYKSNGFSYEPYETAKITKVVIVDKDGVERGSAGSGANIFVIKDNPIAYNVNMAQAARAILAKIDQLNFDPVIKLETVGLPWIECGDAVMAYTRLNTVRAFVLSRTLKGIQALSDSFSADTDQYQPIYKPTVQTQISQTNTALAQTNSNVTSVDNRVTGVDNRVTGVSNQVTNISGQVTTISGQVVNINGSVNNLNGQVTNLNSNVTNINGQVTNLNSAVNNINGQVTNLNSNVTNINSSITNINSDITNIKNVVAQSITTSNFSTYYANAARVYSGRMTASVMESDSVIAKYSASILGESAQWKSANVRLANGGTAYINYLGHS